MNLEFNEFLRMMTAVLIVLLIVQGLDYIFGFGVNNYVFIVFCIVFAFTVGAVYHNILITESTKVVEEEKENNNAEEMDLAESDDVENVENGFIQ